MKISLVSIFVGDPMAAHTFYTETLGFKSHLFLPEHYVAIIVSAEEPHGTAILLEPNEAPVASNYQQGIREMKLPCMVFSTPDLDAEYGRLKAAGVEFLKPPTKSEWGYDAIFDDGFGNYLQIEQKP